MWSRLETSEFSYKYLLNCAPGSGRAGGPEVFERVSQLKAYAAHGEFCGFLACEIR